jgi:tRNA dimethylallyltransferase
MSSYDAVLIAGPTASGKSAAALQLAQALGGTIINADSMQVYREAPILTAQPGAADQARLPHLLYGHVSARDVYSVGRYAEDAAAALEKVRNAGRLPIFTGGTGLYFMALTDGLAQIPETPPEVRESARAKLEDIGVAALHAELMALDPKTASGLRPTDPQRVLRAYEVFEATGRPLVDWQQSPSEPILKNLRLAKILVDPPREISRQRIAERFEAMVENGGLEEALRLKDLAPALPAAKLLGLRPLIALGENKLSRAEALELAITATRQFAKRQGTWFRQRMPEYVRFDPDKGNIISIFSENFA